jgi:hypothetical protein
MRGATIAWLLHGAANAGGPAPIPVYGEPEPAWRDPEPAAAVAPPGPAEAAGEPAVDVEAHLAHLLSNAVEIGDDAAGDEAVWAMLQIAARDAADRYHTGGPIGGVHYTCDQIRRIHEKLDDARTAP